MSQRPRRTREEIIYEILLTLSVKQGSRITHIMQKTRLNYYQAKSYLKILTERGHIAEKNGIYILLNRGKQFITHYEALKTVNKR